MAREGRWGRGRAAGGEAGVPAGAVQSVDDARSTRPRRRGTQPRARRRRHRAGDPTPTPPRPARDRADATDDGTEPEPPAFRLGDLTPLLLIRAAHPRQALLTAVGMAVAAALAGRPSRELLLILGTVLVGPGDPRLVQRPGRPPARRPPPAHRQAARRRPARPGHGVVLPGPRGVPGGAAVGRATGCTPGRRTSSRWRSACSASGSGCARASSRGCPGRRRTRSTRRSSPTAAGAARSAAPRRSCSSPGWPRCSGSACTC